MLPLKTLLRLDYHMSCRCQLEHIPNNVEFWWPYVTVSNSWYPCSLAILRGSKSGYLNMSDSQLYQSQPVGSKRKANNKDIMSIILFYNLLFSLDLSVLYKQVDCQVPFTKESYHSLHSLRK